MNALDLLASTAQSKLSLRFGSSLSHFYVSTHRPAVTISLISVVSTDFAREVGRNPALAPIQERGCVGVEGHQPQQRDKSGRDILFQRPSKALRKGQRPSPGAAT